MADIADVIRDAPSTTLLRGLLARCGLAPLLDMIGDEYPQYANELHEIVNRVESDVAALIGRKS